MSSICVEPKHLDDRNGALFRSACLLCRQLRGVAACKYTMAIFSYASGFHGSR